MTVPSETDYSRLADYRRIVLLTEGFSTPFLAKTAISLLRYRKDDIAAVLDRQTTATTADELFGVGGQVPVVSSLGQVPKMDAVFVGIAPPGGKLPAAWRPLLIEALVRRVDLVSGLHDFISDDTELLGIATEANCAVIDVRRNHFKHTAQGYDFPSDCLRVQTVGHDCTVGKMAAAYEIQLELSRRGRDSRFLATGQTGIMISGAGVPIDCVVADFVNGAIETLVRENERHEFLIIEGQGSISHPAYSAVTLGLLHGAAPDGLIYCYEAGRRNVKGFGEIPIPPAEQLIAAFETVANLRHPCRVVGVAVNTRTMDSRRAIDEIRRAEDEFGLPVTDVYREGAGTLVDAVESLRAEIVAR